MTYDEALNYLYEQLPMYSRTGKSAYKEDLHNIIALCKKLNNPHSFLKCIHVAGTNGKGSTSHMLAAILQQAGYKTGLYTSPHIKNFGERIRINGEMISQDFVINFTEKIKDTVLAIQPSFFEVTLVMAFEYFASEKTDVVVLETGLGGRLDSTNIINPILSIITNIGMDHMDILGNTIAEIAAEKAGIIKKDVPVVIGEVTGETKDIFIKKANELNAPILLAEEKYLVEYIADEGGFLQCNIKEIESNVVEKLRLDLVGTYQSKNARTVLCSVEVLRKQGFTISEKALHEGFENVKNTTGLQGRWEVLQRDPDLIIDAAHNANGMLEVLAQLNQNYPNAKIHFVLGFVKDKNAAEILQLFPTDAAYYFTNAHIPRALPHATLKTLAAENYLVGESFDDINMAIASALKNARSADVIMVCGSFYILGEIANFGEQKFPA